MSRSSLLLIAFLPLLLAANIAINDVPIKLQEQQNQIILTTNITANATTNATKADAALLNVPGSADIRLQLQPEGLSDGSECEGRKCPTNAAVETLVTEQARQLNNTWDVLVKQPLERAKDGLLRGLQDAWSSLKNGFENAGGNLQNATSSVVWARGVCLGVAMYIVFLWFVSMFVLLVQSSPLFAKPIITTINNNNKNHHHQQHQ